MASTTSFFTIFIALCFMTCGLFVNFLQLLTLAILPFSRKYYRIANITLSSALWCQLVWLVDWWAGVKVRIYTDEETVKKMGKEHTILICNHRSDIDWLVGWVIAQRCGCLGGCRALIKISASYLPVVGWSMWFCEYTFLRRNWAKDEETLKTSMAGLKDFPRPMWMATFPEGTRFTPAKLKAAQEFAVRAGLPEPTQTLVPRTKGFVSVVQGTREFVPVVYDMALAIPKDTTQPTMLGLLHGRSSTIHVHVRRVPITEIPTGDEELAKWLHNTWQAKDLLLRKHEENNTFGEELYQPTVHRTFSSLLLATGWFLGFATVAVQGTIKGVQNGFITLGTLPYAAGALLVVAFLVQILLSFTMSEHSTPPSQLSGSSTSSKTKTVSHNKAE